MVSLTGNIQRILFFHFRQFDTLILLIEMEDEGERKVQNGPKTFCWHLDTTVSRLEMKIMKQSAVERCCYSYVTHRLAYVTA